MLMLPLFATAQSTSELAIAGKATTDITPDLTIVSITINATHMDYSKAMDLLQDKAFETKRFLTQKGLEKTHISSENFAINKQHVYENRTQIFKGYQASLRIKLEFKNNLELANTLLNALGESASDAEVNVWHEVSQELQDDVNDKLIIAAIKDAKHKAEMIAESTNQELYKIKKINYGVKDNLTVAPQIESKYLALERSSSNNSNNLSITPEAVHYSQEIIIYWSLMLKQNCK